ncbi:MAG: hypothetical protein ACXAAP_01900 [Candidatus Thorarchaeota archaeon]
MTREETIRRLRRAAKERIRKAEDEERIQSLADAIGDRRQRDVLDILATCEQEDSWQTSAGYLINASSQRYTRPIGIGGLQPKIEPMKYREIVFQIFSCTGLEPVHEDTVSLLKETEAESSIANAVQVFTEHTITSSLEQVQQGDSLFFDSTNLSGPTTRMFKEELERTRDREIKHMKLEQNGDSLSIKPLWHTEYGRKALAGLGIQGNTLDITQLDIVLSVIQVPRQIKSILSKTISSQNIEIDTFHGPSNNHYRTLLEAIISQDLNQLRLLGSKYSLPAIRSLTLKKADEFSRTESSEDYRSFLLCVDSHVTIRALDSIMTLENLLEIRNSQINTPAIMALGNFYHESSSAVLIDMICTSSDEEILQACEAALLNVQQRSPETTGLIEEYLSKSSCRNLSYLKRIYKHFSDKSHNHYNQ